MQNKGLHSNGYKEQFIDLAGERVIYYTKGEGIPVLYLHSADGFIPTPYLEKLTQKRKVIVPIFPGFDETSYIKTVDSMESLAALCHELLLNKKIEDIDVVGFSFGAWVAGWWSILYPNDIQRLTMIASAGFRDQPMPPATREEWKSLLTKYPNNAVYPPKPYHVKKKNLQAVYYYHGQEYLDERLLKRLEESTTKVLIIFGTEDEVMPASCGKRLKAVLKNAQLTYLKDARHFLEIDQPEELHNHIECFFKRDHLI